MTQCQVFTSIFQVEEHNHSASFQCYYCNACQVIQGSCKFLWLHPVAHLNVGISLHPAHYRQIKQAAGKMCTNNVSISQVTYIIKMKKKSILAHLLNICVTLSSPLLTTLIHCAIFITQNCMCHSVITIPDHTDTMCHHHHTKLYVSFCHHHS